jgi:hypothetical protein
MGLCLGALSKFGLSWTFKALYCPLSAGGGSPQVAMEGDTVTIHYICRDEQGAVVDDSSRAEEPVSFEVGAGEVTGNPLFQVRLTCSTLSWQAGRHACMHGCIRMHTCVQACMRAYAQEAEEAEQASSGDLLRCSLCQAFDEAIRGQPLGSTTLLEARGGEWQRELFFEARWKPSLALHAWARMHSQTVRLGLTGGQSTSHADV